MGKPYLMKEAQILQEVEATAGTLVAVAEADSFIASDVSLTPSYADTANESLSSGVFSKEAGTSGVRSATLEFKVALVGGTGAGVEPAGAAEGSWGQLLLGCGFSETVSPATSVTYAPASPETALSMAVQVPGAGGAGEDMLFIMRGCMGNVKFTLKAGELMWATFTFTGAWDPPVDGTLLVRATAWDATVPLAFAAPVLAIHGTSVSFDQIEIDMGQEVGLRPDANTTGGILAAQITNRRVTGTIDIEAEKIATFDVWGKTLADATGAITMTPIGSAAGNKLDFILPKVRLKEPGIADRNGVMTTPVAFEALRSATAGNDELSIVLT